MNSTVRNVSKHNYLEEKVLEYNIERKVTSSDNCTFRHTLITFQHGFQQLGKCPRLRRRQNPCLQALRKIKNTLFFSQIWLMKMIECLNIEIKIVMQTHQETGRLPMPT